MNIKCSLLLAILVVIVSTQSTECLPHSFQSSQEPASESEVLTDDKNSLADVYTKADEQLLSEIAEAEWKKAMLAKITNLMSKMKMENDLASAKQAEISTDSDLNDNELVNLNELLASQTDRVNKRMMVEKPKRMKNSNYDYKHNCHLGLGMGYICHAHSISKYTLLQKILADPTGPGRR